VRRELRRRGGKPRRLGDGRLVRVGVGSGLWFDTIDGSVSLRTRNAAGLEVRVAE